MKVPTELLPCPFCGNTNPFLEGHPQARHVTCNNDLCQASIMPEATDAKAIAAWNRRVPSSELLELREAVAWRPGEAPKDGRSYWLAFDEADPMTCEGRWQHGAWVVAASFYDASRLPPMAFRELRIGNKAPIAWKPMPDARSLQSHNTGEA